MPLWAFQVLRTLVAALSFFFLMGSYYILKPTREPLLFQHIGSEYLQHFYIASSFTTLIGIILYNYLVSRYPRTPLLRIFFLGISFIFVLFWASFVWSGGPKYYLVVKVASYFMFVSLYLLFLKALFLSFNHDVHTVEEAKSFYPYIFLGAQLGIVFGSNLVRGVIRDPSSFLAQAGTYLSTTFLGKEIGKGFDSMFLLSILGIILAWLMLEVFKYFDPKLEENRYAKPSNTGAIKDLGIFLKNRYVFFIGLLMVFATFTSTLSDQQYKRILDHSILTDDNKAIILEEGDLQDSDKLLGAIKKGERLFDQYLQKRFSSSFWEKENKSLEKEILAELNRLIQDKEEFWSSGGFVKKNETTKENQIELSQRLSFLIEKNPTGEELVLANRLLLEEAYPQAIHSSQKLLQTRFFSNVYGNMAWCNILMCLIITPLLLRFFGPAMAITLYPLVLFAGGIIFVLGLEMRVIEYFVVAALSLNYTLYAVGLEIFYIPTGKEIKYKAKTACDTFLFRIGDTASSIFVLFYIFVLDLLPSISDPSLIGISYIVFATVLFWIPVIFMTSKIYEKKVAEHERDVVLT